MMTYSKSLQFYVQEHFSEIAPQFVNPIFCWLLYLCHSLLLNNSVSPRCSFLNPITLLTCCNWHVPPAVPFFNTTHFSSLLLALSQVFEIGCCHQIHDELIFFSIWYVFDVVLWIKYWFVRFANRSILSSFTFYTSSQLYWNWGCIHVRFYVLWQLIHNLKPVTCLQMTVDNVNMLIIKHDVICSKEASITRQDWISL